MRSFGLLLLGLAAPSACGPAGPPRYGDAGHPLKIYPAVDLLDPGKEKDLERRIESALRRERLWDGVDTLEVDRYGIRLWATPEVHRRFPEILERLRRR